MALREEGGGGGKVSRFSWNKKGIVWRLVSDIKVDVWWLVMKNGTS